MSGIVGYVGRKQAPSILLDGLRKLEYLGYDSAGLAVGSARGLEVRQANGSLRNLQAAVRLDPVRGTFGIGHTGWASRPVRLTDARRSRDDRRSRLAVALVGTPTNLDSLVRNLPRAGRDRIDSPEATLARLVTHFQTRGTSLEEALRLCAAEIHGNCALLVISREDPGKIVVAHLGLAVMIGLGRNESFVASDLPALVSRTRDMIRLERGDTAVLTTQGVLVTGSDGHPVSRDVHHVLFDPLMAEKSGYKHFMLKEIFEQPRSIRETILGRLDGTTGTVFLDELGVTRHELREISHLNVIGSGSSWHAGLAAKAMIERLARVHVEVEYGSEFRYSDPVVDERVLSLVITESGETADAVESQKLAHEMGSNTIAVCNSVTSPVALSARGAIYTNAGPELAAESTKAFMSQLTALYLFAMYLGQVRGRMDPEESKACAKDLLHLPRLAEATLELAGQCERIARQVAHAGKALFLGRGIHFPVALEGARKLQELAHIQAIGCAAGEMRHGPTAVIDADMIVVVLATVDEASPTSRLRYEKTLAQVRDVRARQGRVICIANRGDLRIHRHAHEVIAVPPTRELLQPVVEMIPLQLLAYYTAVQMGRDIDQPLDLGRKVTAD